MRVYWKRVARWKDFFHFTRSERLGTGVLLIILLTVVALPYLLPRLFLATPISDSGFQQEVDSFMASLKEREKQPSPDYKRDYTNRNRPQKERKLFPFDPNRLDSAGFVSLGLKPFQAKNILKYRAKGGKYRTADDFAKVYSLSPELFAELKPYIRILPEEKSSKDLLKTFTAEAEPLQMPQIVELNSADTTALMTLKGIKSKSAHKIVNYRKRLGGFVRKEQLLEVMMPDNYERVVPCITIDTSLVVKINVNKASVEWLMKHPYLNFHIAKSICDKREQKFRAQKRLTCVADLRDLPSLSEEVLVKIAPYLEFK